MMTDAQLDRMEWFDLGHSPTNEVGGAIECVVSQTETIRIFDDGSWSIIGKKGKGGHGAPVRFTGYN